MKKIAVVIFVKTPNLSPCKTRLANDIGEDLALDFYMKSLETTQKIIQEINHPDFYIDPYFAVAEKEGMNSKSWTAFHRIYQGEGTFGMRLHKVYDELIQKYDGVIFLGSDCPHIKKDVLLFTLDHFLSGTEDFILGKSLDGGFYIFGGEKRLFSEIWTSVIYSHPDTADKFIQSLKKMGSVKLVEESFDIDFMSDLEKYYYIDEKKLNETQKSFISWVKEEILDKDKK